MADADADKTPPALTADAPNPETVEGGRVEKSEAEPETEERSGGAETGMEAVEAGEEKPDVSTDRQAKIEEADTGESRDESTAAAEQREPRLRSTDTDGCDLADHSRPREAKEEPEEESQCSQVECEKSKPVCEDGDKPGGSGGGGGGAELDKRRPSLEISSSDGEPLSRMDSEDSRYESNWRMHRYHSSWAPVSQGTLCAAAEMASAGDTSYKWSKEQTEAFIRMRAGNDHLFTGAKNSAILGWRIVLEKMGLLGRVEPQQAKKKWDNLKKKYKDCKYPMTGEGASGKPTAATWPWFNLMDDVLGQRPSTAPPVLIASLPENTPRPAANVADQEEEEAEEGEEQPVPGPTGRRKRDRGDELLELLREDMRQHKEEMRLLREAEERRERESKERIERLFSLLERMVERC